MKRILIKNGKYFLFFFVIIFLICLYGCNGSTPVINAFFANPSAIVAGESSTLSWTVTDADTVSIDYGIGTVDLTGITTVNPTTDTTYTLIATNSAGPVTATATVTVVPIETLTLQPGSEGKDADVWEVNTDINTGNEPIFNIGYSLEKWRGRAYLEFDLNPNPLPEGAVVVGGDLRLYQYDGTGEDIQIGVYPVTSSWSESSIAWDNQPNSSSIAEYTDVFNSGATDVWCIWHVDDLVKGWLDGSINNYGILVRPTYESSNDQAAYFRSSDYTEASKHPELRIFYSIP